MSTESFDSLVNRLNQFFFDCLKRWESSHLDDAYRPRHEMVREALISFSLWDSYQAFKGLKPENPPVKLTDTRHFLSILACAKKISDDISSSVGVSLFNKECWAPSLTFGLFQYGPGELGDLYKQVFDQMNSLFSGHEQWSEILPQVISLVNESTSLPEKAASLEEILSPKLPESAEPGSALGAMEEVVDPASLVKKSSPMRDPSGSTRHLLTLVAVFSPPGPPLKEGLPSISEEDPEEATCPEELGSPLFGGVDSVLGRLPTSSSPSKGKPKRHGVICTVMLPGGAKETMTENQYKKLCQQKGPKPSLIAKTVGGRNTAGVSHPEDFVS
jgi:hypothetical protein